MKLSKYKIGGLCLGKGPLVSLSFVSEQILTNQCLHQFVPVDFTNQAPGIIVVCDVGGVLSQQIADDLVDGVVAFSVKASNTLRRIRRIFSLSSQGTVNFWVFASVMVSASLQ